MYEKKKSFDSPVVIVSLKVVVEVKRGTATVAGKKKAEPSVRKCERRWKNNCILSLKYNPLCVEDPLLLRWLTCTCLQLSVWLFLTGVVWALRRGWCLKKKKTRSLILTISITRFIKMWSSFIFKLYSESASQNKTVITRNNISCVFFFNQQCEFSHSSASLFSAEVSLKSFSRHKLGIFLHKRRQLKAKISAFENL